MVTFTIEILNRKLHFLRSVSNQNSLKFMTYLVIVLLMISCSLMLMFQMEGVDSMK